MNLLLFWRLEGAVQDVPIDKPASEKIKSTMIASDTTLIPKNSLEGADIRSTPYISEESHDLTGKALNEHLKKPYIIGPLLPDDISEKNEYENKDGNKGDMGFPEKTGKTGQILSSEDVESDDDEIGPSVSDFLNFSVIKDLVYIL